MTRSNRRLARINKSCKLKAKQKPEVAHVITVSKTVRTLKPLTAN